MATYHKKIEYQGVQGGFLVLRPSVDDYRGMMDVMLHTEFKIYEGWNSSLIGWHWGGMVWKSHFCFGFFHNLTCVDCARSCALLLLQGIRPHSDADS